MKNGLSFAFCIMAFLSLSLSHGYLVYKVEVQRCEIDIIKERLIILSPPTQIAEADQSKKEYLVADKLITFE